jgi:hypothetical protein
VHSRRIKNSPKIVESYIMNKSNSFRIFFPAVGFSIFYLISESYDYYKLVFFIISIILLFISLKNAIIKRPCGHGLICQSGIFYWPLVIDKCHKCGERLSDNVNTQ